jgi:hypothetical protein
VETTSSPAAARHWDAVTREIDRSRIGPVTVPMVLATGVLLGGSIVTWVVASGRDLALVIAIGAAGTIGSGVVAAAVNAFARPPRARRAFEAFVHLGEWELDRVAALAGRTVKPTPDAMRRLMASVAERAGDRWLRVELLIAGGELDEAAAVADRMPTDTPYDRVERASALVLIDWLRGGSGDPTSIRDAVREVVPGDGDERRRAEIILALAEVRQRIGRGATGSDALEPLGRVRERLGPAANDALLRMTRRAAPSFVQTAGAFVFLLLVLDWVGVL